MTAGQWWIAALSEQLARGEALAVVCDGRQLALYRNGEGEASALDDRCPHRRVPQSPGLVKPSGLQSPDHGWTFDGASGQCTDLPNLGDPRRDGRHLVLDRGAVWKGKGLGPAFVRDHLLLVWTRVLLAGGDLIAELLDAVERAPVTVFVAANADRRGTTSLAWRCFLHRHAGGAPLGWRLRRLAGSASFIVKRMIDGQAVAALEVAPSRDRRPVAPSVRERKPA